MSLPIQSQNRSSRSPSKSSLRQVSGLNSNIKTVTSTNPNPAPTTHFASEPTQHHFLPHSPPNQTLDYEEDDDALTYENDGSYPTASQPQIPLQPFFTLIEDTVTSEHYHPTVHYIFADDEPDIITEAACRSLDQGETPDSTESQAQEQEQNEPQSPLDSRLPPPRPGIREHYIILDVQPTPTLPSTPAQQFSDRLPSPSPSSVETALALQSTKTYPYTVTSAQSLSTDWQVFRTDITDAPTMNAEQEPIDQHLMLRIEGRGNSPDKLVQRREEETMEDLIERFQTRLTEIRHLMTDLDLAEQEEVHDIGGEADLFPGGVSLRDVGYQPSGFGNAVLDEQD